MSQITYGLIGASLKHSLSVVIHSAVFKRLGIDAQYQTFELPEQDLGKFLSGCFVNSIRGLNVTIPYKEAVMKFMTKSDHGFAAATGAVNTIKVDEKVLTGYNTDGDGFIDALNRIESKTKGEKFKFKGRTCVVLGAGGAAKAVSFALASSNVGYIGIYDIDRVRTESLTSKLKAKFSRLNCEGLDTDKQLEKIRTSDILVNATPVGMKPGDPQLVKEDLLHKDLFVFDCVYNPSGRVMTALVETARQRGARAYDGLWMLICQAVASEKIWRGAEIPQQGVFEIMAEALTEKGYQLC